MANNVQQFQQPQQQQGNSSPHHCKECGIYMNSVESLEVHVNYHKENLLNKWATQAAGSHSEETNNNNSSGSSGGSKVKREFISNTIAAAADSSDSMMKKSPEYGSRATPENNINFGHPPTPQSYHSASSPYQTPDNSAFSPGFQNYQPIKQERASPNPHFPQQQQQNYGFQESQFFNMDGQNQHAGYSQEYHKMSVQNSFRYHPYQQHGGYGDRGNSQVSSSSPAYPPQPTPSPSPKQCDKCGYVCESASQLIDHLNVSHPPTPAPHLAGYSSSNHFIFGHPAPDVKQEEDAQSEILDLDSHKVVHQVYQEDDKRHNGEIGNGHNPHSVSAMLSWPQQQLQQQQQQKMFGEQRMFLSSEQKMFQNGLADGKMFQAEQKLFQPHQVHSPEYMGGGVTTTSQEQSPQPYRPFDHLNPQGTTPIISSTQVPNQSVAPPSSQPKSTNWKSNEARRPKTYNCTACNKWFTSSGHLKRHYNTTLHKNAVKSSGQPDPAVLPISAHHHPARESTSSREDGQSSSPTDDSRSEDGMNSSYERPGGLPGLLQQPPAGPYDRQPAPNIHHPLHSPMGHQPSLNNMPASPPNGEAGPSATNIDSRGLLSISNSPGTSNTHPHTHSQHGFNIPPPMMASMDNSQFQMYPNECAPHVTQVTATNSLSTTGEYHHHHQHQQQEQHQQQLHQQYQQQLHQQHQEPETSESQPLPSFAQFNSRFGLLLGYNVANVGGPGPATAPYSYATYAPETDVQLYRQDEDYKLTVLTAAATDDHLTAYSPPNPDNPILNNNNNNILMDPEPKINTIEDIKINFETQPASPEKARIKRDYEETTGSPQISSTVQLQARKNGIHKCYDCDKVFNKSCYLTQHNKTFHSGDKPFKCIRCGKRFGCDETYQEHTNKHAGEKPHKCDLCPKQFNHKTDLRRHMCLHTGQKPYACETCGKGFIRKDHMLKHCETHTKKTHHSKIMQSVR